MAAIIGFFFELTHTDDILLDLTTPPRREDNTMSKHQRKHTKQARRRDFQDKEGNPINVTFKRPVERFRELFQEELQIQWDELKLVHELSRWL